MTVGLQTTFGFQEASCDTVTRCVTTVVLGVGEAESWTSRVTV